MNSVLQKMQAIGIIPVVKIDHVEDAVPLAKALCEGGLPCAEVTFRTDAAEGAIKAMADAFPDMLIGAGTVLTTEQVDRAVNAGAKFIVSPGLNPKVVRYCTEKGIPVTPGCSSPTDVEQAIELGLEVVKFFPAEAAGGLPMIKAMAAPYHKMMFMPTGGISPKNLNEYLSFPKILACGGSWMVNDALLKAGNFEEIRRLTEEAVYTMLGFSLAHIGINAADGAEAGSIADQFKNIFGFAREDKEKSIFAGPDLEIMKGCGRGDMGHIGVFTNSVYRAQQFLETKGFVFEESTSAFDVNGKKILIHLRDLIGGFSVHLLQRQQ